MEVGEEDYISRQVMGVAGGGWQAGVVASAGGGGSGRKRSLASGSEDVW